MRAGSGLALAGDLTDVEQMPRLIETVLAHFGRLDVLINNASSFYATPVGSITAAQFDDLIGTNLRAPLFLSQAAAPALRASKGLILNIADIHGQRPLQGPHRLFRGKGGPRHADEVARARTRAGRSA